MAAAGDVMLLMRGLAKLSQAVLETQASTLRAGAGGEGLQAAAQSIQMSAEQGLSAAMMKMQVRRKGEGERSLLSVCHVRK